MPLYIGERCSKCNTGVMTHPELYVFTCSHCGYSYSINPVGRNETIRVLKKPFTRAKK